MGQYVNGCQDASRKMRYINPNEDSKEALRKDKEERKKQERKEREIERQQAEDRDWDSPDYYTNDG